MVISTDLQFALADCHEVGKILLRSHTVETEARGLGTELPLG